MNVLSLFDGMSCAQLALTRAGIPITNYYASEIDKFAMQVTMANFPNTIQLGTVVNVDVAALPKIDIIMGGSPCQSFSFAGKRKGMATKCETEILSLDHYLQLKNDGFEFEGQSYLFWEYMRVLTDARKINPEVKFLLENVEMGDKWENILSRAIGVKGIHINSALVSAQNRKRIYWCNWGMEPQGLFGDMASVIPQPTDKGIILKDVLEKEVSEKYFLSEKALEYLLRAKTERTENVRYNDGSEKTSTITANYMRGVHNGGETYVKVDKIGCVKNNQDKASCFTAGGNSGGNHSDMDLILIIPEATVKGYIEVKPGECFDMENPTSTTRRGRGMKTKTNCLMAGETQFMQYTHDYRIRRLTPTECERLQTVPDGYTNHVSDSQRYRMLGNGWTVDTVVHLLSYLK